MHNSQLWLVFKKYNIENVSPIFLYSSYKTIEIGSPRTAHFPKSCILKKMDNLPPFHPLSVDARDGQVTYNM